MAEEMRRHEPAVRNYLRAQFPSLEADDVVQDSYLKVLRARTVGRIASTKAYFFSVARNTARTLFRRRRLFSPLAVSELAATEVLSEDPDAAESANLQQRLEMVTLAIDQLPAQCRKVLRLAVLEGRSSGEIALRLGLSESTVRVQLARGIKRCAEFLRGKGEG